MHILSISAYYHDSAAALVVDNEIKIPVKNYEFYQ
jgi:predicted NodU family carbamoyl transferase